MTEANQAFTNESLGEKCQVLGKVGEENPSFREKKQVLEKKTQVLKRMSKFKLGLNIQSLYGLRIMGSRP